MDEANENESAGEELSTSSSDAEDENDVISLISSSPTAAGAALGPVTTVEVALNSVEPPNMGASVSYNGSIEDDKVRKPQIVTFNRNLPACHQYMGTDLEVVSAGLHIFETDCIVDNVPLLPIPNFILMPNQILPLNNFHPRLISMFRAIIANAKSFGVVNLLGRDSTEYDEDGENGDFVAHVGTLAEVLAYKEETEHEITLMKMQVLGRQRFKILDTRHQDSVLISKIRILPDVEVENFLHCIEPSCSSSCRLRSKSQNRKNSLLASIHMPAFVTDMYDVHNIVQRVTEELKQWYDEDKIIEMSKNSITFSFWVASNLPITDDMKMHLLSMNCSLQRLRFELSLIQRCTAFVCRVCSERIGRSNRVFSMSYIGPLGAYVNPYGSVHEILTLSNLDSPHCVSLIGRSHLEYSWFPGYAWTICQCKRCETHVGWRFTCEKNSDLIPKEFWGITRRAIHPVMDKIGDLDDDEPTPPCM